MKSLKPRLGTNEAEIQTRVGEQEKKRNDLTFRRVGGREA